MSLADKMNRFSSSIFVQLEEARDRAIANGRDIIDLSVGTPDFAPAPHILEAFKSCLDDMDVYKYAIRDYTQLVEAAQAWYDRRYGVTLARENICGLTGSQDGLAHLPLMLLNPGDVAILPDPGYPMFQTGIHLACAETYLTPMSEENGYIPDLDAIPEDICRRAKLMLISYPANPCCKLAPEGFFDRVVAFGKKHDIVILHDNAYSELTYDGRLGGSFLAAKGALDVGMEFNSLSKSYNLTGARISFALGRADLVAGLSRLKSNIDYGIFRPVQKMAVAALTGPQDCLDELRAKYQSRRDTLTGALHAAGWDITPPEGTMFAWGRLPDYVPDSDAFVLDLLAETGVIFVPGLAFGERGRRYVRFALTQPEDRIERSIERVGAYLRKYR